VCVYVCMYYYYYYYYAAFNVPCVGHKADESQARGHVDLRVAVSVIKRFKFLFESICMLAYNSGTSRAIVSKFSG